MIYKASKDLTFVSDAVADDTFTVVRFTGVEALSRPYEFDITVVAEDPDVDLKAVLQSAARLVVVRDDEEFPFNGVLAHFEQLHEVERHVFYRAVLVPRLWRATLSQDNQLFLDTTVPDIIEQVLSQAGVTDYELKLTRGYDSWEYVCQYRESHLDFISRWMEREGIYYYFEQGDSGEKLIITDSSTAHQDIPGEAAVPYSPPSGLIPSESEVVKAFLCRHTALPAKVILKDYNYRKPTLEVKAEAEVASDGHGDVHIYGEHFKDPGQGQTLAKIRAEELLCREQVFSGECTAPGFTPGFIFDLTDHYRSGYDQRYLLTGVEHCGTRPGELLAGLGEGPAGDEQELTYANTFTCIPADVQFRPERTTPRPRISGSMNATVDAAGGGQLAELDDQGRYKVVLPLDLSGRSGGKASRFVRMAQPYSGATATDGAKGPSGMHFPLHKGAEVLLTFVDGDPDRPIISGAVPNPDTRSPVTAANQTKNVIRDYYGNELVFDSTPGNEHILLHSPHHQSGIEIGKSWHGFTASDAIEMTMGNKLSGVCGSKMDINVGQLCDIRLGNTWDIWAGFGIDFAFGGKISWNIGYDIKTLTSPVIQLTSLDILSAAGADQILSAADQVCILGGESKKTKSKKKFKKKYKSTDKASVAASSNRSIVNVFPEKITLSVSNKDDTYEFDDEARTIGKHKGGGEIFSKTPPPGPLWGAAIFSTIVSTCLASIGWMTEGLAKWDSHDGDGVSSEEWKWSDTGQAISGVTTPILSTVYAAIVGWILEDYISDKGIEPVAQRKPVGKMEINHDGRVKIYSQENIKTNENFVATGVAKFDEKKNDKKLRGWWVGNKKINVGTVLNVDTGNSHTDGSNIELTQEGNVSVEAVKGLRLITNEKNIFMKTKKGKIRAVTETFQINGNLTVKGAVRADRYEGG